MLARSMRISANVQPARDRRRSVAAAAVDLAHAALEIVQVDGGREVGLVAFGLRFDRGKDGSQKAEEVAHG